MIKLNYPQGKSYQPVWRCIYCGDSSSPSTLTKEHIIPKALNGTLTLPKSSCKRCAEITRDVEDFCLNNTFLDTRTMLGLKTSKKIRPPMKIWQETADGKEFWREVGKDKHPLMFAAFDIGRPGILIGRSPDVDPPMDMRLIAPNNSAVNFAYLKNKEGVRFKVDTDMYARMLAKIAHAFAVANYGLDRHEYVLQRHIIGEKTNIFHYVGNANFTLNKSDETLHCVSIIDDAGFVIVYLTLFYYLSAPTYEIVVARPL